MESVIQKIRQARESAIKKQSETYITETVVDGCHVTMHFDEIGDKKIMAVIQSMLMSAYLETAFATGHRGECV